MNRTLLSKTKSELIELIKRNVEISVNEGADSLGLATTTIRQHLTTLENQRIVKTRSKRHGRGRPRLLYALTDRGEAFFEEYDQEFLSGLMAFLFEKGLGDVVHEYIERLADSLSQKLDLEGSDAAERGSALISFFRRRGFMPEIDETPAGETLLTLRHCPYSTVAGCSKRVCDIEKQWLQDIWGSDVERTRHRLEGDDACTYCLASGNA
ncbi:MAG: helix-turn-helix transcriptional regulator [Myxococcota bacterium]